jgi:hypothetical protein
VHEDDVLGRSWGEGNDLGRSRGRLRRWRGRRHGLHLDQRPEGRRACSRVARRHVSRPGPGRVFSRSAPRSVRALAATPGSARSPRPVADSGAGGGREHDLRSSSRSRGPSTNVADARVGAMAQCDRRSRGPDRTGGLVVDHHRERGLAEPVPELVDEIAESQALEGREPQLPRDDHPDELRRGSTPGKPAWAAWFTAQHGRGASTNVADARVGQPVWDVAVPVVRRNAIAGSRSQPANEGEGAPAVALGASDRALAEEDLDRMEVEVIPREAGDARR